MDHATGARCLDAQIRLVTFGTIAYGKIRSCSYCSSMFGLIISSKNEDDLLFGFDHNLGRSADVFFGNKAFNGKFHV